MRGQFTFTQIEGTVGTIQENGYELIISGSSLDQVKKELTVLDKTVLFQMKRVEKRVKSLEKKLDFAKEHNDVRLAMEYEDQLVTLKKDLAELKQTLYKEYWAEREDGTLSVPAGFWGICEQIVSNAHLNHEIPHVEIPVIDGKSPRNYQLEGVEELLKYRRASCVIPTGAGKTLMIAMMANSFVKAGKRVCIIEPTIELVKQTKQFLERYIPNTSGLGGKFKFKLGNDILVTTINSAVKYIDMYDCVIVDEMQHSAAESYVATGFLAIKARYYYGFTACPIRADGLTLGIHASCGPVVYQKDTKWGIENGFLSGAKICMVEVKMRAYPDNVLAQKVYNYHMHSTKVCSIVMELLQKARSSGKKVLILYKTVQAGLALREYAKQIGIEFDVASSEFRNPLDKFRAGEVDFLVANSGLMAEGVDVPNIDCVINCVQNASENLTRQIMGRGLRLAGGKNHLVMFDVFTTGYKQFMGSAHARKAIYKTTGCEMRIIVR